MTYNNTEDQCPLITKEDYEVYDVEIKDEQIPVGSLVDLYKLCIEVSRSQDFDPVWFRQRILEILN